VILTETRRFFRSFDDNDRDVTSVATSTMTSSVMAHPSKPAIPVKRTTTRATTAAAASLRVDLRTSSGRLAHGFCGVASIGLLDCSTVLIG
jgi:hypothetical protein